MSKNPYPLVRKMTKAQRIRSLQDAVEQLWKAKQLMNSSMQMISGVINHEELTPATASRLKALGLGE